MARYGRGIVETCSCGESRTRPLTDGELEEELRRNVDAIKGRAPVEAFDPTLGWVDPDETEELPIFELASDGDAAPI